jgi:hypothetical protein
MEFGQEAEAIAREGETMDLSNPTTLVIVAVVLLVLGGLLAMALTQFQRTRRLRDRFGPEYERTMKQVGDKRRAEEELEARMAHVESLQIRSLSADEVNRFALEWQAIQTEFVDSPLAAVQKANRLIREVMGARGYPVEDFEQRAADISVDHPDLVTHYRELHAIAKKGEQETINTEEMRQAMVHGRDVFENLVQPGNVEETRQKETV